MPASFPVWQIAFSVFAMAITAFSHYLMSTTIANKPWNTATMVIHALSVAADTLIVKTSIVFLKVNTGFVLVLLMSMGHAYFLYRARRLQWLTLTGKLVLATIGMELICSVIAVLINLLTGISTRVMQFYSLEDLLNPMTFTWSTSLTCIACCVITLLLSGWRRLRAQREAHAFNPRLRILGMYIQLGAMILISILMIFFTGLSLKAVSMYAYFDRQFALYPILLIFAALFILISISYFLQDIRYLQQLRRNETLEHQIAMSGSLLTSLRMFRHNMINMLYGFEGAILSGDNQVIRDYYRELTDRCALVNNENIVALQRLCSPTVSSLLLRFLERAQEENLPVNLYVQDGMRFARALPDAELCEILGVLLDNALEAAVHAKVRHVSIEMRSVGGDSEVIIKNTYAGHVTEAQLTRDCGSGKPGHSGCGLAGCRRLLARRKKAFLNMQVSMQYVCAQLLILS